MICRRCRSELDNDVRYCPNCGACLNKEQKPGLTEFTTEDIQILREMPGLGSRFKIIRQLGTGGMGVVVQAIDLELDEKLALKILKPEIARKSENIKRFKQEIKIARRIKHPNICSIFDLLVFGTTYVISMEYIDGLDMSVHIRNGTIPEDQVLRIITGIGLALDSAHEMKVIHRDLKPANIMIDGSFRPVVMDFGIAWYAGASEITSQGNVLGTPSYMAPEQLEGKTPDPRVDIYALGIIMYELCTGLLPFRGDGPLEIAVQHLTQPVPRPTSLNPELDSNLESIIMKCLQKKPDSRYQSAAELLIDLRRLSEKPVGTTRKGCILVVDDDAETREHMTRALTAHQFEVHTASNGEEALDQIGRIHPDLILMDLIMPKMDGVRAAELIGRNPRDSAIPIFLVTSVESKEYRAFSRSIGIKEYLTKPIQIPMLIDKIKLHMDLSRLPKRIPGVKKRN